MYDVFLTQGFSNRLIVGHNLDKVQIASYLCCLIPFIPLGL